MFSFRRWFGSVPKIRTAEADFTGLCRLGRVGGCTREKKEGIVLTHVFERFLQYIAVGAARKLTDQRMVFPEVRFQLVTDMIYSSADGCFCNPEMFSDVFLSGIAELKLKNNLLGFREITDYG